MKFKGILIVILLILLTGCSNEYTLEIKNNKFKENIDIVIPKNIIPSMTQEYLEEGVDFDDQITPFIEQDTPSILTNNKFYKKRVIENSDYFQIGMSYKYDEKEFKQANSINQCFQYPELDFSENYYINLQGAFYCLYTDSIDIKISTKNKVYINNADEVIGNTYIWHINEENSDYVDIRIEVDKGISISTVITAIFCVLVVILLSTIIYKFYKKRKEENSI